MSDIKLDRCDVVDYVKNTLDNSKTNFDHLTGAKYHHNTKYCDASSVIRFGILTMSELNRLKLRHDSPESLKIMNDTLSQVNGLNGVSLAVTGLDDLYPDEDEFDPFLSDAVDFRIADTLSPRPGRDSTKYGNEFIYRGIIKPEEFRAIDIRILEYIEELKNNYNNLLDMLKVLKDANLDIPVRETFGGFSIDKEKMSECPRIVIK